MVDVVVTVEQPNTAKYNGLETKIILLFAESRTWTFQGNHIVRTMATKIH